MTRTMMRTLMILFAICLMITAVIVLLGENFSSDENALKVVVFPEVVACDPLVKKCSTRNQNQRISLIFPNKIYYLKAFPIEVDLSDFEGEAIKKVEVVFSMQDMNMGVNAFVLNREKGNKAEANSVADQQWRGTGLLPVCVTGRVDWMARIVIRSETHESRAQFNIKVLHETP